MNKHDAVSIDLEGKVCVVTRANGGIGQSICQHVLALGAHVMETDIAPVTSLSFSDGANGNHGSYKQNFTYRSFDLLSDHGLADCSQWIMQSKPDVLVNNAAIFDMGSILEADLAQYDKLFALNVRAAYLLMQTAGKAMIRDNIHGSIINMASQAGHRGEALVAHYCATKAAIISYTQSAALALAPYNIRVNAISPGVIDTPMWKQVDALFAKFENLKIGEKKRLVGKAVPLGHMGSPNDVAKASVFLASQQSTYITAQTINVDGGNVLR